MTPGEERLAAPLSAVPRTTGSADRVPRERPDGIVHRQTAIRTAMRQCPGAVGSTSPPRNGE